MSAVVDSETFKKRKLILCKFMNGNVKEDSEEKLKCRVLHRSSQSDLKTKDQKIMVSESEDMTYIGKNFGRYRCNPNRTIKQYVGIYDEKSGKMRICDAEMFHMMPHVPGRDDDDTPLPQHNYVQKLGMLTEAFGSKWKKSALEKQQRNMIDEGTMKDHLAADIHHGKQQVKLHQLQKEETKNTQSVLDVIPPCNKNAENVEDVYSLSDILSEIDMDSLQSPAAVFFDSTPAQIKEWKDNKTYPAYVLSHVSSMSLDPLIRWERSKCLIYLYYMIHLYKLSPKELRQKDPFPKDCPGNMKSKLSENFTKQAVKTRCMPSRLKDRLAAYILTLCLLIDEFSVELIDLMKDMQLERS
ncbi:DNA-directed RNA polymerase I subunit RPA49-like, partial [Ruditapes philippinarum]|uniref:DNA-directed RNA polymerase I subunit RPA49-like n=1 Tax=Ruditapes philippinarum TaxID=129788 RepID=UPI00295B57E0